MLAKLLTIIVAATVTGAALLALRHEHIVTAHRMSVLLADIRRHEHTLADLRCRTAELLKLDEVRRLRDELVIPLQPLAVPEPIADRFPENLPPLAPPRPATESGIGPQNARTAAWHGGELE